MHIYFLVGLHNNHARRWLGKSTQPHPQYNQPRDTKLIYYGLVMPYGVIDLGSHWISLRVWYKIGTKPLHEPVLNYCQLNP